MSSAQKVEAVEDLAAVGVVAVKVAVGVCLINQSYNSWMIGLVEIELSFPR